MRITSAFGLQERLKNLHSLPAGLAAPMSALVESSHCQIKSEPLQFMHRSVSLRSPAARLAVSCRADPLPRLRGVIPPSAVHSKNLTCTTSSDLTHSNSCISSAVTPPPQRDDFARTGSRTDTPRRAAASASRPYDLPVSSQLLLHLRHARQQRIERRNGAQRDAYVSVGKSPKAHPPAAQDGWHLFVRP